MVLSRQQVLKVASSFTHSFHRGHRAPPTHSPLYYTKHLLSHRATASSWLSPKLSRTCCALLLTVQCAYDRHLTALLFPKQNSVLLRGLSSARRNPVEIYSSVSNKYVAALYSLPPDPILCDPACNLCTAMEKLQPPVPLLISRRPSLSFLSSLSFAGSLPHCTIPYSVPQLTFSNEPPPRRSRLSPRRVTLRREAGQTIPAMDW